MDSDNINIIPPRHVPPNKPLPLPPQNRPPNPLGTPPVPRMPQGEDAHKHIEESTSDMIQNKLHSFFGTVVGICTKLPLKYVAVTALGGVALALGAVLVLMATAAMGAAAPAAGAMTVFALFSALLVLGVGTFATGYGAGACMVSFDFITGGTANRDDTPRQRQIPQNNPENPPLPQPPPVPPQNPVRHEDEDGDNDDLDLPDHPGHPPPPRPDELPPPPQKTPPKKDEDDNLRLSTESYDNLSFSNNSLRSSSGSQPFHPPEPPQKLQDPPQQVQNLPQRPPLQNEFLPAVDFLPQQLHDQNPPNVPPQAQNSPRQLHSELLPAVDFPPQAARPEEQPQQKQSQQSPPRGFENKNPDSPPSYHLDQTLNIYPSKSSPESRQQQQAVNPLRSSSRSNKNFTKSNKDLEESIYATPPARRRKSPPQSPPLKERKNKQIPNAVELPPHLVFAVQSPQDKQPEFPPYKQPEFPSQMQSQQPPIQFQQPQAQPIPVSAIAKAKAKITIKNPEARNESDQEVQQKSLEVLQEMTKTLHALQAQIAEQSNKQHTPTPDLSNIIVTPPEIPMKPRPLTHTAARVLAQEWVQIEDPQENIPPVLKVEEKRVVVKVEEPPPKVEEKKLEKIEQVKKEKVGGVKKQEKIERKKERPIKQVKPAKPPINVHKAKGKGGPSEADLEAAARAARAAEVAHLSQAKVDANTKLEEIKVGDEHLVDVLARISTDQVQEIMHFLMKCYIVNYRPNNWEERRAALDKIMVKAKDTQGNQKDYKLTDILENRIYITHQQTLKQKLNLYYGNRTSQEQRAKVRKSNKKI